MSIKLFILYSLDISFLKDADMLKYLIPIALLLLSSCIVEPDSPNNSPISSSQNGLITELSSENIYSQYSSVNYSSSHTETMNSSITYVSSFREIKNSSFNYSSSMSSPIVSGASSFTTQSSNEYSSNENSSYTSSFDEKYNNDTPYSSSIGQRGFLTYDDAFANQFIDFSVHGSGGRIADTARTMHLTVLSRGVGYYYQYSTPPSDTNIRIYSRGVSAQIPDDQADEGHVEDFSLNFGVPITNANQFYEIYGVYYTESNTFFRDEFLFLGDHNFVYTNFSYNQSYMWEIGSSDRKITITDIKNIWDKDNMLFVSGEFSGGLETGWDNTFTNGPVSNGTFSIILEN